ncbi:MULTISPECIES: DUF4239 domain-containing protein [unclassified Afipia]|uniref:bestrophin-like domain n=1 Tax=unclassified Afipia TaxID=2642050 RepID=UPI00041930AC|nr:MULTISPECIES: DUF4239 domain-containing protein [unclassified Afipia]
MIRAWLDLAPGGIFAVLIVLYFGMPLLLAVFTFCRPFKPYFQSLSGVVAPFFSGIAMLFALLTGFLANDVAVRGRQAYNAVHAEAGELRNVHTLSVASASDMRAIRAALKAYVNSVVNEEWPAMDEMKTSPATGAAYDSLLREVSVPSIAKDSGQAVHAALLNATVRAGTARNDRLSLASDHTNDLKWLAVIALGLLTQVGIALAHLDKPRAFLASLAVFASAAVVALGLIALQEYPFDGTFQVSSDPIKALQSLSD